MSENYLRKLNMSDDFWERMRRIQEMEADIERRLSFLENKVREMKKDE